ncbi:glycosyltransferase family 4 protein [Microbacterium sp. A84]|uniref:glycosyltransferase family 4 protein n=1 Tax=Microbacterium sp. A84 TaxID=3450715 RepID=UPI003F4324D5
MRERRPTVAIATRLYPPEATAASFRMRAIADALSEDHDVTVLTTTPPHVAGAPTMHADEHGAVTVRRAPVLRDRSGAIRGYFQYLSFDIPAFFRLLVTRADVIVAEAPPTTGMIALVAAWLKRTPLVYYPGDVWTDGVIAMGASAPVIAIMRWMESQVLKRSRRVLSVSPEVTQRLIALGAEDVRITEVGNGIDTRVFNTDVNPRSVERAYFVYTGTMSEWQEPGIFIRALAQLDQEVDLHFFGQGSAEAGLRALAAELAPDRVHFGGVVSPAESASWIRGAAAALVSIVPGIGYDFARPTKTYAAGACGTPVLFAGAATGGQVVRDGELGESVDFVTEQVSAAMGRLIEQAQSGHTEQRRQTRASWIDENYSLAAAGDRAARAVRAATGTTTGGI